MSLSLSLSLFPWLAFIPRHFCSPYHPSQPSHWLAVSLVGVKFISSSYQVCSIRHGQESCNLCNIYWRTEEGGGATVLRSPPFRTFCSGCHEKTSYLSIFAPPQSVPPFFEFLCTPLPWSSIFFFTNVVRQKSVIHIHFLLLAKVN